MGYAQTTSLNAQMAISQIDHLDFTFPLNSSIRRALALVTRSPPHLLQLDEVSARIRFLVCLFFFALKFYFFFPILVIWLVFIVFGDVVFDMNSCCDLVVVCVRYVRNFSVCKKCGFLVRRREHLLRCDGIWVCRGWNCLATVINGKWML